MTGSEAFKLCRPCEDRMNQMALRPVEWYRLARLHDPCLDCLSGEHYSDGGVALSAHTEFEEEPDVLRAPVLADVRHDLGLLWGHTLTRRHLKPKLLAAWREHPKAAVADHLMKIWKTRKDERARSLILQLCGECLARAGADLVRLAWVEYSRAKPRLRTVRMPSARNQPDIRALLNQMLNGNDAPVDGDDDDRLSRGRRQAQEANTKRATEQAGDDGDYGDAGGVIQMAEPTRAGIDEGMLAWASAECLPEAEGFAQVVAVVEAAPEGMRRDQVHLLASFGSRRSLDWTEVHVETPVTSEWGKVAALSSLDWARVTAWLSKGRPLSHVALDALQSLIMDCGEPTSDTHGVRLIDPPNRKTLRQVLKAHLANDPAPRVQDRVDFILTHPDVLLEGKPYE